MSIFEELGRKVEQFKQTVETAAEGDPDYRCRACDARFQTEYAECPDCGSAEIGPATTEES